MVRLATFRYSAKDANGQTVIGTLAAGSEQEAAGALREQGLVPQKIAEESAAHASASFGELLSRVFLGPPLARQMFFFQQLATMLSAGMSVGNALERIAGRIRGRLRRPVVEAQEHVTAGGRLSEVLDRYPWLFSGLPVSLTQAGEETGGLDRAARLAAEYLEKEINIRRKFSRATLYPKLLLLVVFLIATLPLPVLNRPVVLLPMSPVSVLIIALILWLVLRIALQFPAIAAAFDAFKLVIPVIGGTVRKFALAKFSRAMAILYSAGIPVSNCVETAARASGNQAISKSLAAAAGPLRQGVGLEAALTRTGALTSLAGDMVATGEVTGNLDEVLGKVADYYEAEAESSMDKMALISGVVGFVLVAIIVGYAVISAYERLYSGYPGLE